jgi:hypothetical protein
MNDDLKDAATSTEALPSGWRSVRRWIKLGVIAAVVLPALWWILVLSTARVCEYPSRSLYASNLRQIAQASLLCANKHGGRLPPTQIASDGHLDGYADATVHAVAVLLAREGGLNEGSFWFDPRDRARTNSVPLDFTPVLDPAKERVDPAFAHEMIFAWDFATGLTTDLPPTTPVAWTRGLRPDGTWDPEGGVWGSEGGYIAFLGKPGFPSPVVVFHPDLRSKPLVRPDGTPTSNILETLPTTARIVGSGPATLHGMRGLVEMPAAQSTPPAKSD